MGNNNDRGGKPGYPEGKYLSPIKVGAKGQIVIPKEAREMFDIKPGDTLLLLADVERGIAIHRYEVFQKMVDAAFLLSAEPPAADE